MPGSSQIHLVTNQSRDRDRGSTMKGQPTEIWQIYNKANSTLEIPV